MSTESGESGGVGGSGSTDEYGGSDGVGGSSGEVGQAGSGEIGTTTKMSSWPRTRSSRELTVWDR